MNTSTSGFNDFYRTIVHEIGHALGITGNSGAAISDRLKAVFDTNNAPTGLTLYDGVNLDAMLVGGHLYDGPSGAPRQLHTTSPTVTFTEFGHPNELMNPGTTVPADPPPGSETTRQWISDLDAQILADAYGYSVVLPSTLNTAHVTLDSLTGTLLVQGGMTSAGVAQNDAITIDTVGDNIRVRLYNTSAVNYATELVTASLVKRIVVSAAGDSVPVHPIGITVPLDVVY